MSDCADAELLLCKHSISLSLCLSLFLLDPSRVQVSQDQLDELLTLLIQCE